MKTFWIIVWWLLAFATSAHHEFAAESANGNTVLADLDGLGAPDQSQPDQYDLEDRLVQTVRSTATITLTYDGDGNRVKKTVGAAASWYLVDDRNPTGYAQVLEERTTANGSPTVLYTYGADLLCQTRSGIIRYYVYDALGSVRALVNTSGQLTDSYTYDAYGILIEKRTLSGGSLVPTTGGTVNSYLFTGEQWDADLGMYYLRARYYAPGMGRFWNFDTFEGNHSDPLSLHKYLYAHADPVNGIDPSGHEFSLSGTLTTVGNIVRLATQVAFRAWNAYDKVQTFADGFNALQAVFGSLEDGLDEGDFELALHELNEFAQERLQRRLVSGGLKVVGVVAGRAIGAARSGLEYVGKGRLKFGRFEVRAVRDLSHMNEDDVRKMLREGSAGKTRSGDQIQLHHHKQNPDGPIVEIPRKFHKNPGNANQHPNGTTPGGGLDPDERSEFNAWRKDYWKARAAEELAKRGLL